MENFWLRKRKEKEAKAKLADTLQILITQALGTAATKKNKGKIWIP